MVGVGVTGSCTTPSVRPSGTPAALQLRLIGDFNNWDPFMNPMKQVGDDLYSVTLRVAPGTHAYYFVSGGTPIAGCPSISARPIGCR